MLHPNPQSPITIKNSEQKLNIKNINISLNKNKFIKEKLQIKV